MHEQLEDTLCRCADPSRTCSQDLDLVFGRQWDVHVGTADASPDRTRDLTLPK